LEENGSFEVQQEVMQSEDWSKPSSCCRKRVSSNSKATFFLTWGTSSVPRKECISWQLAFSSYFYYV